jgi:hypothetical protein
MMHRRTESWRGGNQAWMLLIEQPYIKASRADGDADAARYGCAGPCNPSAAYVVGWSGWIVAGIYRRIAGGHVIDGL